MAIKKQIFLFLKGAAMGAADVVPGVSGGTIAFISGIYETLIDSINSVDQAAFKLLLSFKIKELWNHVNGNFLAVLFAGILFSVAALSRLILFLLETYPELIWSFFFGLIVASASVIIPKITKWSPGTIIAGLVGIVIAYIVTVSGQAQTPESLWFIFLSGALAICAMILPGISGSFILLLLNKYEFILNSIKDLNIIVIITFMLGCVSGLLSFAKLLKFLLTNYHNVFVALLTGFMIGSLNKVWPWKETLETIIDRHGKEIPVLQQNISPLNYQEVTGSDPMMVASILMAFVGFALIVSLTRLSSKKDEVTV